MERTTSGRLPPLPLGQVAARRRRVHSAGDIEECLAHLDDPVDQRLLIALKGTTELETLNLKGSSLSASRIAQSILSVASGLRSLVLADCPQVTWALLPTIAAYCTQLQHLDLQKHEISAKTGFEKRASFRRLRSPRRDKSQGTPKTIGKSSGVPRLKSPKQLSLPHLQELNMSGWANLSKLNLEAPALRALRMAYCPKLSSLQLCTPQISLVDLRGCAQVSRRDVASIINRYPSAKVIVTGCTRLAKGKEGELIVRCPQLLNATLDLFPIEQIPNLKAVVLGERRSWPVRDLREDEQGRKAALAISLALASGPPLDALSIENVTTQISPLLRSLSKCSALTSLRIKGCQLSNIHLATLVGGLSTLTDLRQLAISRNKIDARGTERLAGTIAGLPQLRSISFARQPVNAAALRLIGKAAKGHRLRRVDLRGCVMRAKTETLPPALQLSRDKLRGLSILKVFRDVQVLDLKGNGIGDGTAQLMARALEDPQTPLLKLGLANNKIGDVGALNLARALMKSPPLLSLELHGNPIGQRGIVRGIAPMLKTNTRLQRITLGAFGGKVIQVPVYWRIEEDEAIASNKTKLVLETAHWIGRESAASLICALAANSSLTSFGLRASEVRGCLGPLVRKLKGDSAIREFDLAGTWLESKEAAQIANMLTYNTSLRVVNLDDTLLSAEDGQLLLRALKKNHTLEVLSLRGNLIPAEDEAEIQRSLLHKDEAG